MTIKNIYAPIIAGIALTAAPPGFAKDLRIDGFASIYAGQALDKDELGGGNFRGYDDKAALQPDSKYGIQFRGDLDDGLAITAQVVGEGEEDYKAKVTWAFLSYNVTDQFTVKAGRQRIPFFLYSDFLQVGYAYPWISPPDETYVIGGFENIDGINFEYLTEMGDWLSRANFILGRTDTTLENDGSELDLSSSNFTGVTWNLNYDWFTFQTTYSQSDVTISAYNDVAGGINQITGGGLTPAQLELLSIDDTSSSFAGIGVAGDWGEWLASAEYTLLELEDAPTTSDRKSWYVFGGYRWNKYTFGLTYGQQKNPNNDDTIATIDAIQPTLDFVAAGAGGAADAVAQAAAAQLSAALPALYRSGSESKSYTFSLRYDFHASAAFKFEYVRQETDYDMSDGSAVTTLEPSLIRLGVDLIF